jgi:lauroyl/myristoyl acyltransferase
VIPVFVRTGIRRPDAHCRPVRSTTRADTVAAFSDTVRTFERLVREHPAQWLTFEDVWRDEPAEASGAREMTPKASRTPHRSRG